MTEGFKNFLKNKADERQKLLDSFRRILKGREIAYIRPSSKFFTFEDSEVMAYCKQNLGANEGIYGQVVYGLVDFVDIMEDVGYNTYSFSRALIKLSKILPVTQRDVDDLLYHLRGRRGYVVVDGMEYVFARNMLIH